MESRVVQALEVLYEYLKTNNYNVEKIINRITKTTAGLCINIPEDSFLHQKCPEVTYVSLIIPPENYSLSNKIIYETALSCNNGVIYNEELGYGDIRRFGTPNEVNQELERLGLRNR